MRSRTSNLLIRSQPLYPIELWVHSDTVWPGGNLFAVAIISLALPSGSIVCPAKSPAKPVLPSPEPLIVAWACKFRRKVFCLD